MTATQNMYLVLAGICSLLAALLHLAVIAGGPSWYRTFGAGEQMAQMAERGLWYPAAMTLVVAAVLTVWGLYALSGAGIVRTLPLLKPALCAITAIYLLRGLFFGLPQRYLAANSTEFWYWSSGICLVIGVLHLLGLYQSWSRL